MHGFQLPAAQVLAHLQRGKPDSMSSQDWLQRFLSMDRSALEELCAHAATAAQEKLIQPAAEDVLSEQHKKCGRLSFAKRA